MIIDDDCCLRCHKRTAPAGPRCEELIPKDAQAGYTCLCGARHLFIPMWECCGKYMDQGTFTKEPCPYCKPSRNKVFRALQKMRVT